MDVYVYAKTTNGLPDTTQPVEYPTVSGLQFTHGALWGPTEASFTVTGSLDDAFWYAEQYLGNMVQIWSPSDSQQVWEGYIESVSFGYGTRVRTRSLEGYANKTIVLFNLIDPSTSPPTDLGKGTPATASDTTGQATYGIIEYIHTAGGITTTTASNIATDELARRKALLYTPEGSAIEGGFEVRCVGMYKTLFRQSYTSTTTGTADINTIIQAILTAKGPFISTDYTRMTTTGKTTKQQFSKYELAGEIIKALMATVAGYTFRIDFGRVPVLEASQRSATTATYIERLDGGIMDTSNQDVMPWLVRPDAILRQADFVPSGSALTATVATESVENIYLVETTYDADSNTVTWKPAIAGADGELGI